MHAAWCKFPYCSEPDGRGTPWSSMTQKDHPMDLLFTHRYPVGSHRGHTDHFKSSFNHHVCVSYQTREERRGAKWSDPTRKHEITPKLPHFLREDAHRAQPLAATGRQSSLSQGDVPHLENPGSAPGRHVKWFSATGNHHDCIYLSIRLVCLNT